jgi:glycine cleavage system aminomethyltransferase T
MIRQERECVLEIAPARVAIIRCFGKARVLDGFPSIDAVTARVTADELWLVSSRAAGGELLRRATSYLAGADPDGLVLEHSEAWSVWSLSGAESRTAFARLADFPLPEGRVAFAQGALAQVPAKILAVGDRLQVIVPVQLGHHLPERVLEACSDLQPKVGDEREFVAEKTA